MRLVVTSFALMALAACRTTALDPASELAATEDDKIFLKIGERREGEAEQYELSFSAPANVTVLRVCINKSGKECALDDGAVILAPLARADESRRFFHWQDVTIPLSPTLKLGVAAEREEGYIVHTLTFEDNEKRYSRGTGGVKGQVVDGLTATAAGLTTQYRVYAPSANDADTPHPLVVFLHGDGGSNFGPQTLDSRIIRPTGAYGQPKPTIDQAWDEGQAAPTGLWNNVVFVSVLSPTLNGPYFTWDTSLSNQRKDAHAAYLDELVQQHVLTRYNVDTKNIFWVGQSGGGIFVSGTLLPRLASRYSGGAIMLCGGRAARPDIANPFDPSFKTKFKLSYQTTGGEYPELRAQINAGVAAYRGIMGDDRVSFASLGNGDHCLFPPNSQPTLIRPLIEQMIQ